MNRREFLVRLGQLSLLGLPVSMSGCLSNTSGSSSAAEISDQATATPPPSGASRREQQLAGRHRPQGEILHLTPVSPLAGSDW